MKHNSIPLEEISINGLFHRNDNAKYEVPIYQRNYAWGKDEITALIQDVYDAYVKNKDVYYIGTLVSFKRNDDTYEVIDGQQRLTTITLVLKALNVDVHNHLTYRARERSNYTIAQIPHFSGDEEMDKGIKNGFFYAKTAIQELGLIDQQLEKYKNYFLNNICIIHYQVPRDIDLNHYFEIMNSRGEQLEKHEIVKAKLLSILSPNNNDRSTFNTIWENCSDMSTYIQQKYNNQVLFGTELCDFITTDFTSVANSSERNSQRGKVSISNILFDELENRETSILETKDKPDTFQPIIDFSNFLLIVLKLTLIRTNPYFECTKFNLDDKELLNEFSVIKTENQVKQFGFNLLKAKYLLDNYMVHHTNDEDSIDNNPWKLQRWQKEGKKGYLINLSKENDIQDKMVQLLSMFEVSFTARQRKNYLFYCLLYLFDCEIFTGDQVQLNDYCAFVDALAKKYINNIYLISSNLNEINTPIPGCFDMELIISGQVDTHIENFHGESDFIRIYGDGATVSKGIPLFIFNYLDYKLWLFYADKMRGKKYRKENEERKEFFESLGCSDFELKIFDQFYFSRTRRSLEHYFPQANATGVSGVPNEAQINCLGNFAMIGSEANSSGSNWRPKSKLDHYLDASGKIKQISVASIKFLIMMQMCKDNEKERNSGQEWVFKDIRAHQINMLQIMFDTSPMQSDFR